MYCFRCTEQQLGDSLERIHESGDRLLQAVYKGGRDWVLICLKASDEPSVVEVMEGILGPRFGLAGDGTAD